MGNLWQEFKTFAFKGNMIDLAIGVIIGAAFGRVVTSLVENVFMPLLAAIGAGGEGYEGLSFTVNGAEIQYGLFLGALINFLIVAAVIFFIVIKIVKGTLARVKTAPPPGEPTVKECPFCLSDIPILAKRCKFCTADLDDATGAAQGA